MKRMLLAGLCALALVLAGCTAVNQTNSFVELPTPEATETMEITYPPVVTATPDGASLPDITQPPMVQLEVQPTNAPGTTQMPDATQPGAPTPSPTPEGSGGGMNG